MMRFAPALAIFLRQFYLLSGNWTRFLSIIVWISIDMLMWGFVSRYLSGVVAPGIDIVKALLGAALLWSFFTRVMLGVTMAFFEDVWTRNFLNVFATPMSIGQYVLGLVITSICTSTIGLVFIFTLASLIFGFSLFTYGTLLFPFLMVMFLFGIALGILGCAVVLRFGPASEWFVWPIPAIISPFVGVFYPLATLPEWMQKTALILPPSYVFENLRHMIAGQVASVSDLFYGTALAALYILLAGWVFMRVYKHAVRSGLIARYSAESVA